MNFIPDEGAKTLEITGKFVGVSGAISEDVSARNGRARETASQGIAVRGRSRTVRRGCGPAGLLPGGCCVWGLAGLLPRSCRVRRLAWSRLTRARSAGIWRLSSAGARSLWIAVGSGGAALCLRRRTGRRSCGGRGGLSEDPGRRQEQDGKQCCSGFHSLSRLRIDFLLDSCRLG